MKADYWMNLSDKPLSFFLNSMTRCGVAGYEGLSLKPEEIHRELPDELKHCTYALVYLYLCGYPSKTHEEHKRLITSFIEAGLLEHGSEPGNITPTWDGKNILESAGIR